MHGALFDVFVWNLNCASYKMMPISLDTITSIPQYDQPEKSYYVINNRVTDTKSELNIMQNIFRVQNQSKLMILSCFSQIRPNQCINIFGYVFIR